jgi:hypothetical protein
MFFQDFKDKIFGENIANKEETRECRTIFILNFWQPWKKLFKFFKTVIFITCNFVAFIKKGKKGS